MKVPTTRRTRHRRRGEGSNGTGAALIKNPGNVSVAVKGVVYANYKNKTQRIRKNKVLRKAMAAARE